MHKICRAKKKKKLIKLCLLFVTPTVNSSQCRWTCEHINFYLYEEILRFCFFFLWKHTWIFLLAFIYATWIPIPIRVHLLIHFLLFLNLFVSFLSFIFWWLCFIVKLLSYEDARDIAASSQTVNFKIFILSALMF